MYVYYRATTKAHAEYYQKHEELVTNERYWTDGIEPARLYLTDGRAIMKITTINPMPNTIKGVAEGDYAHREWVWNTRQDLQQWLDRNIWEVEIL